MPSSVLNKEIHVQLFQEMNAIRNTLSPVISCFSLQDENINLPNCKSSLTFSLHFVTVISTMLWSYYRGHVARYDSLV